MKIGRALYGKLPVSSVARNAEHFDAGYNDGYSDRNQTSINDDYIAGWRRGRSDRINETNF